MRIGYHSICHVTDIADSDCVNFRTLRWNYDDKASATQALERVAAEEGVPPQECCVIRWFRHPSHEDYDDDEDRDDD